MPTKVIVSISPIRTGFANSVTEPFVSAIIPTLNRPRELRLCLEGFAHQAVPREQFEVVVVDDGSTEPIASVVAPFESQINLRFERRAHAGLAAARNSGIQSARGRFLILYDDDLQPLPDLVARCIEFHEQQPSDGSAELLHFGLHPEIARSPMAQWCFQHIYPFPSNPGPQHLSGFWGGAVTCKRSLFRHALFDPAYLSVEDADFAARVSRLVDLRIDFRGHTTGLMTRAVTIAQVFRREYFRGYFQYRLTQDHPDIWSFHGEPYDAPEASVLQPAELRSLFATVSGMERLLRDGGGASHAEQSELLRGLWIRLELHATAAGWIAARAGRSFDAAAATPPK